MMSWTVVSSVVCRTTTKGPRQEWPVTIPDTAILVVEILLLGAEPSRKNASRYVSINQ